MAVPYKAFDQVIIRSPFYTVDYLCAQLDRFQKDGEHFYDFVRDPALQEAIYIASPGLFGELQKFLKKELPEKEADRVKYSVMRYFTRAATRCTPFGLFAGCCPGRLGDRTQVVVSPATGHSSRTRLDMDYLCALSAHIAGMADIKQHLYYFPNTSLYRFGRKFRYTEYFYSNARRTNRLAEVDVSGYLEKIIVKAAEGAHIEALADLLIDDEIDHDEAVGFINELIEEQVLVSELEPAVTGPDLLSRLLGKLRRVEKNACGEGKTARIAGLVHSLETIDTLLKDLGAHAAGFREHRYDKVTAEVKKLGVDFDPQYLFQTDMLTGGRETTLNRAIEKDVQEAMRLFSKITPRPNETRLSGFIKAFQDRYEEREVPLLQALDNESGIGYPARSSGDINMLIDDLAMPAKKSHRAIEWGKTHAVLLKKYTEAVAEGKYTVTLTEEDFAHLPEQWDDLPPTISIMCEIVGEEDGRFTICLEASGGSSAANLLGRFCYLDRRIEALTKEIARADAQHNPDAIYAEVVHLPESRLGNVLARPALRTYEIPYLARPAVAPEFRIPLSDLMISCRRGRLRLRSARLGKEIIPRQSTAHNFETNVMPVYQFLCDMQVQNGRRSIGFHLNPVFNEYDWLPRVQYKNIIVSPARWMVKKETVKELFTIAGNGPLVEAVRAWRNNARIPRYVVLADGDNRLFADLENAVSIRTLFSAVKKRPSFYLREFLFDRVKGVVKNEEGEVYCNEFILSFYKADLMPAKPDRTSKEAVYTV